MSSFFCDKCKQTNVDTEQGYVSGCGCHKPDLPGHYKCFVRFTDHRGVKMSSFRTVIFENGAWNLDSNLEVIHWEVLPWESSK